MYPNGMAMADVYGKGNVGVMHFDTHYDAASMGFRHHVTHGRPGRLLIEEGYVSGENFIQVGLRAYAPSGGDLAWMREQGMRYHFMAEVERHGWDHVMEHAIAEAGEGADYVYISLDIDVLDPAFAPGTGTPEPGGLSRRGSSSRWCGRLCAEANVVGMEIVELNPLVDQTYVTPLVANRCGREMLTGVSSVGRASPSRTPWRRRRSTTARVERDTPARPHEPGRASRWSPTARSQCAITSPNASSPKGSSTAGSPPGRRLMSYFTDTRQRRGPVSTHETATVPAWLPGVIRA
jgi:hypothetical protein